MGRKAIDLKGQRFGKLTVIKRIYKETEPKSGQAALWLCKCDCGNESVVRASALRQGQVKSCGCSGGKRNSKGQFVKRENIKDITGQRFGKLTVLKFDRIKNGKTYWIVKCDCGTTKSVRSDTLKVITSCGCDKKEQDIINLGIVNHHEMTHHPVYPIWHAMMSRCENQNDNAYSDYGGRGIKVCCEWQDIKTFAKWAEETGFVKGKNLSIERKNVNGDYCPENCCWIDRRMQPRNRRNTVKLEVNGEIKPLAEWAEIYNVSYKKVMGRYYRGIRKIEDLFYKGNLQMRDLGRE